MGLKLIDRIKSMNTGRSLIAGLVLLAASPGLTDADVQMYLRVMRAAVARQQHPTSADIALKKRAASITEATMHGHIPTEAEQAVLEQSFKLSTLDDMVVEQMHINAAHYTAVKERIDEFLEESDGKATPMSAKEEKALLDAWKHDEKVIAPYREELTALNTALLVGSQPDST